MITYGKEYYSIGARHLGSRAPAGFKKWRKANTPRIVEITRPRYATKAEAEAAYAKLSKQERRYYMVVTSTPLFF